MFWTIVLSLVGLFILVNVILAYCPASQRWFQREEARQRQLVQEAEQRAAVAVQEALEELATAASLATESPLEKPRRRVYPTVHRIQP